MEDILLMLDEMVCGDSHAIRAALRDRLITAINVLPESRAQEFAHMEAALTAAYAQRKAEAETKEVWLKKYDEALNGSARLEAENEQLRTQLEAAQQDVDALRAELNTKKEAEHEATNPDGSQAPVPDSDRHQAEG